MNKPTSKPWWASLGFGTPKPAPDTDYADMGTAFGLDASMGSRPGELDAPPKAGPRAPADKRSEGRGPR